MRHTSSFPGSGLPLLTTPLAPSFFSPCFLFLFLSLFFKVGSALSDGRAMVKSRDGCSVPKCGAHEQASTAILAYMACCEVSQDQSDGTPAAAGSQWHFGWFPNYEGRPQPLRRPREPD